jgi:hypothetical protein
MSVTSILLGSNIRHFTIFPQHPILERSVYNLPLVWETNSSTYRPKHQQEKLSFLYLYFHYYKTRETEGKATEQCGSKLS